MAKTPPRRLPIETRNGGLDCETRSFSLQVKAAEDGTIDGYGSVFGVRDNYDDIIAPGAFKTSLGEHKADGTMPAMLWQHDSREPIGVWDAMSEDANGLRVKGRLALDTECGKKAYALLKMGALNGLSIGFISKQWTYDTEAEIRTITEIDLWEVSLVTFPANEKARIANIKSADMATPREAEKTLRDAGFSKTAATAFVSRVMRMGEARRDSADSTAAAIKAADRLLAYLTSK